MGDFIRNVTLVTGLAIGVTAWVYVSECEKKMGSDVTVFPEVSAGGKAHVAIWRQQSGMKNYSQGFII